MADETRDMWRAIEEIKTLSSSTNNTVGRIEERLASHMADPTIHTRPPCEHYKVLSNRLWAVAVSSVSALLAALWSILGEK